MPTKSQEMCLIWEVKVNRMWCLHDRPQTQWSGRWVNTQCRLACALGNGRLGDLDQSLWWGLSKLVAKICLNSFKESTRILISHLRLSAEKEQPRILSPTLGVGFPCAIRESGRKSVSWWFHNCECPGRKAWMVEDPLWNAPANTLPSEQEPKGTGPHRMRN